MYYCPTFLFDQISMSAWLSLNGTGWSLQFSTNHNQQLLKDPFYVTEFPAIFNIVYYQYHKHFYRGGGWGGVKQSYALSEMVLNEVTLY